MVNIGICDDEDVIINQIYKLSQKILNQYGIEYKVYTFVSGQGLLESNEMLDIIFLDIQMSGINGISVGKQISRRTDSKIIYVSNYKEYCMEAINKVHAFAYLEKPINEKNFNEQILAAIETRKIKDIEEKLNFQILFLECDTIKKVIKQFNVLDIYYFEFVSRKIKIKLRQKEYYFIGKLKDIEQNMDKYYFARCHSAYVVNTKHITRISKQEVILDNEERIPVAQRRSLEFRKKVNSNLQLFNYHNGDKYE